MTTGLPASIARWWLLIAAVACLIGCQTEQPSATAAERTAAPAETAISGSPVAAEPAVVDVVGRDFAFDAPDEIAAGWTTFRLLNAGSQPHFLLLYRLPEGRTQADVQAEVVPVYDRVMAALDSRSIDKPAAMEMLGEQLPPWFFTVEFSGGPGLVSPGRTAETTVQLAAGRYLMECYVKGTDGMFHSSMGMQKELQVTDGVRQLTPPTGALRLDVSKSGITMNGQPTAGEHVVRVDFGPAPTGSMPYDVHLARLDPTTDIRTLVHWMDWMNPGGLQAPAPVEFIGGAENMPGGGIAYMRIDLEPGRYAWISEVDAGSGMLHEFTVAELGEVAR